MRLDRHHNVLPVFVEGTIAGAWRPACALGLVGRDAAAYRSKRLVVAVDGRELDCALVDVGLLKSQFVGAGAVWDMASVRHLWVTRAAAHNVGLTSIAATQGIIDPRERCGRWVMLGERSEPGPLAVLAPGLVEPAPIVASQELHQGRSCVVELTEPGVLAWMDANVAPGAHRRSRCSSMAPGCSTRRRHACLGRAGPTAVE